MRQLKKLSKLWGDGAAGASGEPEGARWGHTCVCTMVWGVEDFGKMLSAVIFGKGRGRGAERSTGTRLPCLCLGGVLLGAPRRVLVTLLGWQGGQGCCNISCLGTQSILLSTGARPWFGSCWLGCRRAGCDGAAVVSPKCVDTMHGPTSGAGVWNPTDPSASVALTTLKLG